MDQVSEYLTISSQKPAPAPVFDPKYLTERPIHVLLMRSSLDVYSLIQCSCTLKIYSECCIFFFFAALTKYHKFNSLRQFIHSQSCWSQVQHSVAGFFAQGLTRLKSRYQQACGSLPPGTRGPLPGSLTFDRNSFSSLALQCGILQKGPSNRG